MARRQPTDGAPRKSGIVTRDDALFAIVGKAKSGIPGGLSSRKHG